MKSSKVKGTIAEKLATIILEGKAIKVSPINGFDVYWIDQDSRIEVKRVDITSNQIGKKYLHSDISDNWMKNDYYMVMVYIDNKWDHSYLIPSADITNRIPQSKSISLPKNWDDFQFRNRLYAMRTERGAIRI